MRAFSYRGAFVVRCLRDPYAALPSIARIAWLGTDGQWREEVVEEVDRHPKGLKLKVRTVDDESTARSWVGREIFVLGELPRGSSAEGYAIGSLIGVPVLSEDGTAVGFLEDVEPVPGGVDRWWIKTPQGPLPIPAATRYIARVEPHEGDKEGRIVVRNLEDLFSDDAGQPDER